MLGMARLTGQTTGASLVALMFVVFPVDGTYASLYFAGGFATLAAIVSFTHPGFLAGTGIIEGKGKEWLTGLFYEWNLYGWYKKDFESNRFSGDNIRRGRVACGRTGKR